MDRRVGGAVMLALALLTALVVPRVLNPPGVGGRAAVAPAPPQPAVGDCLAQSTADLSLTGTGELPVSAPVTVVPCTAPHGGEFVLVEATPPAATGPDAGPAADDLLSRCRDGVTARWESTEPVADDWSPELNLDVGIVGPDRRQVAAGQLWAGCVVGPMEGLIDRPLAALTTGTGPPPQLGRCSRWQAGSDAAVTVACSVPHTVEDLGVRDLERGSPLRQDELAASCAQLAVTATGRSGLVGDPSLAIDTFVSARYDSGNTSPVLAPIPIDAAGGRVRCSVRVADDRNLAGSLRQIGDAPLPWAP